MQKGGTSTGLIKALKAILELDADKFVPGHGNLIGKSDVEAAMKSLQEKQDKVKSLIKEGKSLEEIRAAFGLSAAPAKPGGFSFPGTVEVAYRRIERTSCLFDPGSCMVDTVGAFDKPLYVNQEQKLC